MSSAITNNGSDVISRVVVSEGHFPVCSTDIDSTFCIGYTASWIKRKGVKHIGLQFPDELLYISVSICQKLCEQSGEFCFILGDSSFAGCCVDEVAGQRFHIDALVHYGRACLSELSGQLPVLYVFGQLRPTQALNSDRLSGVAQDIQANLCSCVSPAFRLPVVITYDFRFQTIAYALYQCLWSLLQERGSDTVPLLVWSEPDLTSPAESATPSPFGCDLPPSIFKRCGRSFHCIEASFPTLHYSWTLVHVGPDSDKSAFHRILLGFPEVSRVESFLFDPLSFVLKQADAAIRSFVKRRSYLVEKAKDAQKIGILMGTLSVRGHQCIVKRLQRLLKRLGRFYVTLVVGRLNASKLANLPELDLLVLVACAETSLLDSREMLIPIITPFEMECALSSLAANAADPAGDGGLAARVWTPDKIAIDFLDLLPGGAAYIPEEQVVPAQSSTAEEVVDISLITGRLRLCQSTTKGGTTVEGSSNSALATRGEWALMGTENSSSSFQRSWFGLDPQLGQTPVAKVQEGLHGLPVQYTLPTETEHTNGNPAADS
ncbi:hypothetical protein CRM22_002067 [Opisthorchis felineus]|uniref:Uncharacterized protein n=1 Tax=Opisthorchis felineus TaxID=147828 RepID=A0A4S2MC72_OPIFE|nr:hypothetical protein CRM22_002067 [Opisthorchis felineus]